VSDPQDTESDGYEDPIEIVATGYDQVGAEYSELALMGNVSKDRFTQLILDRLPRGSDVLDLGCGAGRPTTAALAERFNTTGVELSPVQVENARKAVPKARFIQADMSRLEFSDSSFDAIVAFYSIIHVPRDRQRALFASMFSWLRPGGTLVTTLASSGSETWIGDDFYGARMYWSSFEPEVSKGMLSEVGFEVEFAELLTQSFDEDEETHFWVVAQRPTDADQP